MIDTRMHDAPSLFRKLHLSDVQVFGCPKIKWKFRYQTVKEKADDAHAEETKRKRYGSLACQTIWFNRSIVKGVLRFVELGCLSKLRFEKIYRINFRKGGDPNI